MHVMPLPQGFRPRVLAYIDREWGGPLLISRGISHDAQTLPGLVAMEGEEWLGTLLYNSGGTECEVIALFSWQKRRGAATALLNAMVEQARGKGLTRVFLITTNDNTPALRFYQRYGFSICALHLGAMKETLRIKGELSARGIDGIPLEHEIELEKML